MPGFSVNAHHTESQFLTDEGPFLLYRQMRTAREIDRQEQQLVRSGHAFFHVSGAGHESTAVLNSSLTEADWLHLHYRDKALMVARGVSIAEFFRSLLGRRSSHSGGRQMSAHLSCRQRNLLSLVGPVGNNALQCCGIAAALKDSGNQGIVVCSVGDGTTQEGEFLEAVAEAVRWQLPVLFVVTDNGYSISTPTAGKTFFDLPQGPVSQFYGLPLRRVNGRNIANLGPIVEEQVLQVREGRSPAILVFHVDRLDNHTNADEQSRYRAVDDLEEIRELGDPVTLLRRHLLRSGASPSDLDEIDDEIRDAVQRVVEQVLSEEEPTPATTAVAPYQMELLNRSEYRGKTGGQRLTMREVIRDVLRLHLKTDQRVHLYGQDIEDPKGDVFGVTQGLSSAFPGRVVNAPLSESTIVGTAIGRALAGQRPVAFIQFADFLPIAFNQILSEMASMYWRTNGDWSCPVLLMATCGGYRPGLGPFHSQTMDGFAAHIPGVDVVMPSSAADAAGLLNAVFQSPRPTVFLYPKSCLNLEDQATSNDISSQFILPGRARRIRTGEDLTIVTWGNPVQQCRHAADVLEEHGFSVDLIDLRSLAPWDREMVIASAERTGRLIVVHEDNLTGGFGAEVVATVAEAANRTILLRRVARPDTFVPFHFGNQLEILPSFRSILETCAEMLECTIEWDTPEKDPPGESIIRVIGSGPSDEMVDLVDLVVKVGDRVEPGQTVAEVEATKSVVEISTSASGVVKAICASVGDQIAVGQPLMRIQLEGSNGGNRPPSTQEDPGIPHLTRKQAFASTGRHSQMTNKLASDHEKMTIYSSRSASVTGGKVVSSESLAAQIPGWTGDMVRKRTGVRQRNWVTEEQSPVSMAIDAAEHLLFQMKDTAPPIGAILCSVTGPREASPSISCQVASHLRDHPRLSPKHYAFDFNAACSGYLYGLKLAQAILREQPDECVLLLTSEVASPALNPEDPVTVFLFGDAATATLLSPNPCADTPLEITAPISLASPDPDVSIHLPCVGSGAFLTMDGIAVARAAYKGMAHAVRSALNEANLPVESVAALIPHPGSARILKNVAEALDIEPAKVLTTLSETGNTSSSSIPLAIDLYWDELPRNAPLAMTAFGAGFTSAAAIATLPGDPHA